MSLSKPVRGGHRSFPGYRDASCVQGNGIAGCLVLKPDGQVAACLVVGAPVVCNCALISGYFVSRTDQNFWSVQFIRYPGVLKINIVSEVPPWRASFPGGRPSI